MAGWCEWVLDKTNYSASISDFFEDGEKMFRLSDKKNPSQHKLEVLS